MIRGVVNAIREAIVELTVIGAAGRSRRVAFVLDTGFGGGITLPSSIAAELELRPQGVAVATLGDGSETEYDFCEAAVLWDGLERPVVVEYAETFPLLGMALLEGHLLQIEVARSGGVSITPLSLRS
jgi:predicted aspartyl protease